MTVAMPVTPTIGIVLLNWNGYNDTRRCLESLGSSTYQRSIVYVVDNGSTDGSMDRLEFDCRERARFLRNGANLGFSAGCNRGIRRALEDGCEYVLLLNNDCIVAEPTFLERMVARAEGDARVGIVGGKILAWPRQTILWGTGGWLTWVGARYLGHGETDRGQYDRPGERGFVSGALMLIRRRVLEQLGLLPEEYFFGHEDWEYGLRARRMGWRLAYEPGAVVYHEAEHSFEPSHPYYLYNDALSRILFVKRNRSRLSTAAWLAAYGAYVRLLLPLLGRLRPARYVKAGGWRPLRRALLAALREAPRLERVTPAMLEPFRGLPDGS